MAAAPEDLLKQGKLDEALAALQDKVRDNPADPKLRVFLFQLLSVQGNWSRAITQLNLAADMQAENLLMAEVCRPALNAEALRAEIFAGKRAPHLFGEPEEWVGWMVQANHHLAAGELAAAAALRDRAFEAAPAVAGTLNGQPFEWLADGDTRLGPLLEAVIEGRYCWVPMSHISRIDMEGPADLRDVVWTPAHFTWANAGTSVGLIPTRYPGSESSGDPAIQLARRTDWVEKDAGHYLGLGQRMLVTDEGEHPLLEVRSITLGEQPEPPPEVEDDAS